MAAYSLILLDCGDVMLNQIFPNGDMARAALVDWVGENWADEETNPEDLETSELIDCFFEYNEDYSWYMQPVNIPKVQDPGQDILLTPAMCRVIRESLSNFQFNFAQIILNEEEETDLGTGEQVLEKLIAQFE